jgi:hypothetical protein
LCELKGLTKRGEDLDSRWIRFHKENSKQFSRHDASSERLAQTLDDAGAAFEHSGNGRGDGQFG